MTSYERVIKRNALNVHINLFMNNQRKIGKRDLYEGLFKIFRTGSAVDIIVMVAQIISESYCDVLRRMCWTCKDVAKNFDENRTGCLKVTKSRLTLLSSPSSFWRNTKWLSSPNYPNTLIYYPVIFSYFQKLNWSWKKAGFVALRRSRPKHGECLTLTEKNIQEAFQNFRRRWDRCIREGGNTS
jgi:hypothetical protein